MAPLMGSASPDAPRRRPGRPGVRGTGGRAARVVILGAGRRASAAADHGRRYALRSLHPRPQPRPLARGGPSLPRRLETVASSEARHRGGLPRGGHRHRGGARRGCPGSAPGDRTCWSRRCDTDRCWCDISVDQGGASSRPADDALAPDLRGPRIDLLLRGQHARSGAAHVDPRARPTPRCPTRSASPIRAGRAPCGRITHWPRASTWPLARSSTSPWPMPTAWGSPHSPELLD